MPGKFTLKTVFFLLLTFSIFHQPYSIATIRYVSHTGSSTPPYTTWETAADSIQKCINFCVDGDTIIVANGVYKETLFVNKAIWLIGSSIDSTIIDGRGLNGINYDYLTIEIGATVHMLNFTIIGKAPTGSVAIRANFHLLYLENCKILDCEEGVQIGGRSSIVKNSFLLNISNGDAISLAVSDTNYPKIENCLIIINNSINSAISIFNFGHPIISSNIIIGNNSDYGIGIAFGVTTLLIKNNIFSGFTISNISSVGTTDSALIENNVSTYLPENNFNWAGIEGNQNTTIRNNIAAFNNIGIKGNVGVNSEYNLYWGNFSNTSGGVMIDSTDVLGDPMFVNDTIPASDMNFDFHLQQYSPAIDRGDPKILDVDGTRSDIGAYGGPGGEVYTYQDLAPKPPANLTAVYDSGLVKLTWNKNTEADLFRYRVYRDTVPDFIYDTTKIIAVVADSFYFDDVPEKYLAGNYYYKITAIDSAYHQSAASEEVHVNVTGVPEGPLVVIEEYKLLNNYPNPFNPSTKIPYRLKEGGYVKLMIYDIKGELLTVLVNEHQNAGYYEVEFSPDGREIERGRIEYPFATGYRGDIASGIYLYRIEVIGGGTLPRFSDMKKMIYVK